MRFNRTVAAMATVILTTAVAQAAVSPEDAARLGQDLTPTGAVKAGNADGSIPEWTGGGVDNPPAGFDPAKGIYPDENYARECMQLFTIGLYKVKDLSGEYARDKDGNLFHT